MHFYFDEGYVANTSSKTPVYVERNTDLNVWNHIDFILINMRLRNIVKI